LDVLQTSFLPIFGTWDVISCRSCRMVVSKRANTVDEMANWDLSEADLFEIDEPMGKA